MPEMEPDRGAITFGLPAQLFVVQVIRKVKDNLVNILETVEDIVESVGGHLDPKA
jgi:hypothetical protein